MQLHNPTSTDRLCTQLGQNLAAFDVRDVPDGFTPCDGCRCVVYGERQAAKSKAGEGEAGS